MTDANGATSNGAITYATTAAGIDFTFSSASRSHVTTSQITISVTVSVVDTIKGTQTATTTVSFKVDIKDPCDSTMLMATAPITVFMAMKSNYLVKTGAVFSDDKTDAF
jgi:hypothetical protein